MAEVKPIRAWRYHDKHKNRIQDLISPLFDVVSDEQRAKLYADDLNSIHLSVPSKNESEEQVLGRLNHWKSNGDILRDSLPGIYVYYQYFRLPGETHERCRKGFICNVRLYEWDENILLRHENTMRSSVNDRANILDLLQMNVSATHGLYTDNENSILDYLDEAILNPIYESEDYQGVRDVLAVIHDKKVVEKIIKLLSDKQIILADGHHRYAGALQYRQSLREKATLDPESPANYHLMYLTNTENANVSILATHRLVHGVDGFDQNEFIDQLDEYFDITKLNHPNDRQELVPEKKWSFGLLIGQDGYVITLKEGMLSQIYWHFPDAIIEIDLTILHFFVFEKILGIKRDHQRDTDLFSFERSLANCHKKVRNGSAQAAFITRDIPMETIKNVCYSGFTMPQKSTYFYPKVICGYLFNSIDENENNEEIDRCY